MNSYRSQAIVIISTEIRTFLAEFSFPGAIIYNILELLAIIHHFASHRKDCRRWDPNFLPAITKQQFIRPHDKDESVCHWEVCHQGD